MNIPNWLGWARKLQAIAQTGLTYAKHPAEMERYRSIQKISAEILNYGSGIPLENSLELIQDGKGYATPKIGVRALVFQDSKILIVKENIHKLWNIPGGWVDVGDSLVESVTREVKEEAGIEIKVKRLVAIWDADRHNSHPYYYHGFHLCFLCDWVSGEPHGGDDTHAAQFIGQDEINSLQFVSNLEHRWDQIFKWNQSGIAEVCIDEGN